MDRGKHQRKDKNRENQRERRVLSDSEASKRPQTFNSKRRLKHRGFIKADDEELEEALKRWVSVNAERVMKSKELVKLHGTRRVHQESEYAKYAESLIHASLMTYLH
ncbi:hypothetical protein DFH28DRAFT_324822 [Melampsora americana]|nr:hypothetical protein DFH28DRAFT_324822 [Melampsora americana]